MDTLLKPLLWISQNAASHSFITLIAVVLLIPRIVGFIVQQYTQMLNIPIVKKSCIYLIGQAKAAIRHVKRTIYRSGRKKRPKLSLLLGAAITGMTYVMSGSFLFYLVVILGLLCTQPSLPQANFYAGVAAILFLQIACAYYWGTAQRERLSLNKRWRKLMGSDWFKKPSDPS